MDSQKMKEMQAGTENIPDPKGKMTEKPAEKKENNPDGPEEEKEDFKKVFWEYARLIIGCVIVVLFLQNFVFLNARIPSASMQNTVMTGDRIVGSRLSYKFGDPERYDIVIFRYPDNEKKLYIKRIIGMPGETVTIKADGVYINDSTEPLSEDFCPETPDYTQWIGCSWTVPEGCYFMLGDNRNNSGDSRYWNNPFVAREKILAKAEFRYWPLSEITILKHGQDSYYEPEGEQ